jgi:putative membrane protein
MFLTLAFKMENYLAAKSLHLIFMVAWFAGLFYMPRLFIYQTEASGGESKEVVDQLSLMAERLWRIITWPAFILTFIFGVWMLWLNPGVLQQPWMHVKLAFLFLLIAYHFSLQWLYGKLQNYQYPWSSTRLRFYNEVATILLFAIIFTAVFRDTTKWLYGVAGIIGLGILLSLGILLYKKLRKH